ncbi:alpha-hydroxy acid oxidase [Ramlibacter rhizophilus]|uniref:Alpha-hydroxy-acid oxidizing protein n=1 Tax=Ramlibacter rhizophilus TaxID=1781167 RepID=A0A4Z0BPB2_9BURK|nr:alpha-hydroxy acid oxidase [Ramlibacter rhizophilus]TFY99798.1 alpha-hydroxy-acid oxidizing protein [Ramlibacter rhizophilus]
MSTRKSFNLNDFRGLAKKRLPASIFAYIDNGAEDEVSLRWNREAYEAYEFIPQVLVDVSSRSQNIELFGKSYDSPFGISPVGLGALYNFNGDVALAAAAHARKVPYILSGASLTRMEEVTASAPDAWFQAYLPGDPREVERLLQRAKSAGIKDLVITVDVPVSVNPDRYARFGFSSPLRPSWGLMWQGVTHPRWTIGTFLKTLAVHGMPHLENWRADRGSPILSSSAQRDVKNRDRFTWDHVKLAREKWQANLILKGIMSVSDAINSRSIGVNGIIVSNHGGRQADSVAAPLSVLGDIVKAVPELVVMMDGGIRRGSDVLKAVALGARCVFAGRPFNFALAAGGKAGVESAIELLQEEIHRNMALLGLKHPYEMSETQMRLRSVRAG